MSTRNVKSITASITCLVASGGLFLACSGGDGGDGATSGQGGAGSQGAAGDTGAGASGAGTSCETTDDCATGELCGPDSTCIPCPSGICVSGVEPPPANGGKQTVNDDRVIALRAASCAGWSGEAEPRPTVLMFVVDVSTSMKQPDPSGSGFTKWEVTQPVLKEAVAGLPDSTSVGLLFFPNMPTTPSQVARTSDACVDVEPMLDPAPLDGEGSAWRTRLADAIDQTVPPENAGTPTHDAYLVALDALATSGLLGNKYVILLTDGQPTYAQDCVGDGLPEHATATEPIIESIGDALGDAVGTFVIGAPGSELTVKTDEDARPWLSGAAEAGGTAKVDCSHEAVPYCHFDMVAEDDYGTALSEAMSAITRQVVPCDFALPSTPTGEILDRANVNIVLVAGNGDQWLIGRDDRADCTEGWHYSEDGSRVVLCPDSCRDVKLDPRATLEAIVGCMSEPIIE